MAVTAKAGTKLVKNAATGKYKMVPTTGAKKTTTTPGKTTATPPADTFVQDEINRQINQDQGLTNYTDAATGDIASQMAANNAQAAALAAKYKPTAAYVDPTLDAYNQQQVAQATQPSMNANQDQANSIASLIAAQGNAGSTLLDNIRAAGQTQHRDYARYLNGLKPVLDQKHTQELAAAATQKLNDALLKAQTGQIGVQNSLAKDQFGLSVANSASDSAYKNAALAEQTNADAAAASDRSAAAAAKKNAADAANRSKYGFGISKAYDAGIDSLYGTIAEKVVPVIDPQTGKPTGAKTPNTARRWRDVISKLTGLGVRGGQAVLLASKWMPERLTIHGTKSPQVIYTALKDGSLGFKVSDAVAKQVFQFAGLDWNKRNPPATKTTITTSGTITASPGDGTVIPNV